MLWKLPSGLMAAVLLSLLAAPVGAASLEDVLRALEKPFQATTPAGTRIQDYAADFAQEARIASLDRLQQARGRVSVRFDYGGGGQSPVVMFHWEYRDPSPQEIVSDGKTLWVYLPDNNQVIQSVVARGGTARDNDPMAFLTGVGNLSRDFLVSFADPQRDAGGHYVLELRPRRATALLARMTIVVDRRAVEVPGGLHFPILSTTVYDPNGNSTRIAFSNLQVNRNLPPARFTFSIPVGVEVVRPAGDLPGG